LWILRLGKKPVEWYKPTTMGSPPPPRYLHTLNFYEEGNYLIVHGGRNDLISSDSFALNDTYVLDLSKLVWIEVKIFSESPKFNIFNRCGHSAIVYSKYLNKFSKQINYIGRNEQ
jgi:hypothetical protein